MAFLCINQVLLHIVINYVDKLFPESIIILVPIFCQYSKLPAPMPERLRVGDKHSQ